MLKLPKLKADKWIKDIDLLEAYKLSEYKEDPKNKRILFAIFAEMVIILIITAFMKISIYFRQSDVAFLEARIDSYKTQMEEVNRFNQIKNIYEKKLEVYDDIVLKNRAVISFLETMEDVLPKNVMLESLEITDSNASFLVSTDSEEKVAQLLNNMEVSGCFSDICISGITTVEGQKKSSISAKVKGFKGAKLADAEEGSE